MEHSIHFGQSAERWGPLWGARPDDWAYSEEQQVPTYEAAANLGQWDRAANERAMA